MDITINDVKEWIEAHEHPDITTYSHEALKFLLSEVEGLQNTIAQMQDAEDRIYRCRMEGGDRARKLLDDLLAENKQLKTEVERLEKDNKGLSENMFILNKEAVRLEKENAALREVMKELNGVNEVLREQNSATAETNLKLEAVVEAAKKAWNKFSANGESLPCAGGHFVSGSMTINDMILIGEAIEKIKDVETEDEHQERINGLSRNGDE